VSFIAGNKKAAAYQTNPDNTECQADHRLELRAFFIFHIDELPANLPCQPEQTGQTREDPGKPGLQKIKSRKFYLI